MNPVAAYLAGGATRPKRSNLIQPDPTSMQVGWIGLLPLEKAYTDPTDPTFLYKSFYAVNANDQRVEYVRVYARDQYRKVGGSGWIGWIARRQKCPSTSGRRGDPTSSAIQPHFVGECLCNR